MDPHFPSPNIQENVSCMLGLIVIQPLELPGTQRSPSQHFVRLPHQSFFYFSSAVIALSLHSMSHHLTITFTLHLHHSRLYCKPNTYRPLRSKRKRLPNTLRTIENLSMTTAQLTRHKYSFKIKIPDRFSIRVYGDSYI